MADIDDLSVGNDIQNNAFNGPDEMIVESEVGGSVMMRPVTAICTSRQDRVMP